MPEKTSRKMQYLEECFETLACLGDGTDKEVFLVKRKGSDSADTIVKISKPNPGQPLPAKK